MSDFKVTVSPTNEFNVQIRTPGPQGAPGTGGPGGGSGDVVGPSASTDGELALFSGTTGKLLKRGTLTIAASGDAGASQVVKGNDSRLSDARTPLAHTHTASQISDSTTVGRSLLTAASVAAQIAALGLSTVATSGAYTDLSGRPSLATVATTGAYSDLTGKPTLGTAAALNVPASGDAAVGEVVKGSDTRLTNSRTPTSHTHPATDISDSTIAGRALLTAATVAAQKSALAITTSDVSGLGSLATLSTVTLTSNVTGTLPVGNGGIGVATLTAYGVICGGTTGTGPVQSIGVGTTGQALLSNGPGALPSFQTLTGGGNALTANPLSQFASTTSAQLAGVISDETGSSGGGLLVFNNGPTLIAPVLGAATATTINKVTITAPATGSTLTIADGKTLTCSNTLTFAGTDASTLNIGAGGTLGSAAFTASTAYAASTHTHAATDIASGTIAAARMPALTGDVTTSAGAVATTISTGSVTDTKGALSWKPQCKAVSTSNVASLSGATTVDGVSLAAGDLVLLTAQTTASQNGPWTIAAGAWTRPTWYPAAGTVQAFQNAVFGVSQGTANAGSVWYISTTGAITIDTTSVAFTQEKLALGSASVSGLLPASLGGTGISATPANGEILIGNGTNWTKATITAGANVTVTNGAGTITIAATAGGGSGSKTIDRLYPIDNQPPGSNYATLVYRNNHPVYAFDQTVQETAIFTSKVPDGANLTTGLTFIVTWSMTTATSGTAGFDVSFENMTNLDLDADNWTTATNMTLTNCNATSGKTTTVSLAIGIASLQSLAVGDMFRVRLRRNTSGTATGDLELHCLEIQTT